MFLSSDDFAPGVVYNAGPYLVAPLFLPVVLKGLILAALLIGLAGVARAQPARDAAPAELATAEARVGSVVASDSVPHEPRPAFDLSVVSAFWKPPAPWRPVRGWLPAASFLDPSARYAARANPVAPPAGRRINRTFVPIPLVQWQRRSSFITPRGMLAVRPSIVIGRRLTWLPEFARQGRTFGVGVQVRVWLDDTRSADTSQQSSASPAGILSTVRGMLDRR